MQRHKIIHRTYYNFTGLVQFGPHTLRLRPREDHDLRIESSILTVTPPASLLWHRDVEGNAVAIATFDLPARQLAVENEVVIHQYNERPLDFLVADYAVDWPFSYQSDEILLLLPYMRVQEEGNRPLLDEWIENCWHPSERLQAYTLLHRVCTYIHQTLSYKRREAHGVQSVGRTLSQGTGSCRDFTVLFMEAMRHLGIAARFVSGYLQAPPSATNLGATHAWAEVYLSFAGWIGFDPTIGRIAGTDHIAVAATRLPESVAPVYGVFISPPGSRLDVGVWVTRC